MSRATSFCLFPLSPLWFFCLFSLIFSLFVNFSYLFFSLSDFFCFSLTSLCCFSFLFSSSLHLLSQYFTDLTLISFHFSLFFSFFFTSCLLAWFPARWSFLFARLGGPCLRVVVRLSLSPSRSLAQPRLFLCPPSHLLSSSLPLFSYLTHFHLLLLSLPLSHAPLSFSHAHFLISLSLSLFFQQFI